MRRLRWASVVGCGRRRHRGRRGFREQQLSIDSAAGRQIGRRAAACTAVTVSPTAGDPAAASARRSAPAPRAPPRSREARRPPHLGRHQQTAARRRPPAERGSSADATPDPSVGRPADARRCIAWRRRCHAAGGALAQASVAARSVRAAGRPSPGRPSSPPLPRGPSTRSAGQEVVSAGCCRCGDHTRLSLLRSAARRAGLVHRGSASLCPAGAPRGRGAITRPAHQAGPRQRDPASRSPLSSPGCPPPLDTRRRSPRPSRDPITTRRRDHTARRYPPRARRPAPRAARRGDSSRSARACPVGPTERQPCRL